MPPGYEPQHTPEDIPKPARSQIDNRAVTLPMTRLGAEGT